MGKMKKFFAAALVVAMVGALTACSSNTNESNEDQTNGSTVESNENTENTESSTIKMGLITLHDENSTYDLNFINAAKAACEAAGVELVIKSNIDESDACYEAACELIEDEGCNFIFADSFGHESYIYQAAKEYSDVQFSHATGTSAHVYQLENFHNAFASIYEGRYLAGVAAGLKLNEMIANGEITADEAKIGYVGAYTYAEVISGYTSFFLGARSVCESATMEVTFTGSWYDESSEKEGANTLINDGCVLISQHADSMGAPTACENAGIPDVSYNGSTVDSCPNTFIVSSYINWAPYFQYCFECIENGTQIAYDWTGTIETGSVCLTDLGSIAPAEGTAEKLAEVQAELEAGTLHVFSTDSFTVNGETLTEYLADVDGDYVGETNVIHDGYFDESGADFRSAPYFDIQIDGITLLDTKF